MRWGDLSQELCHARWIIMVILHHHILIEAQSVLNNLSRSNCFRYAMSCASVAFIPFWCRSVTIMWIFLLHMVVSECLAILRSTLQQSDEHGKESSRHYGAVCITLQYIQLYQSAAWTALRALVKLCEAPTGLRELPSKHVIIFRLLCKTLNYPFSIWAMSVFSCSTVQCAEAAAVQFSFQAAVK